MLNVDVIVILRGRGRAWSDECLWHPCGGVFIVYFLTDEFHCLLGDHVGLQTGIILDDGLNVAVKIGSTTLALARGDLRTPVGGRTYLST